MTTATSTPVPQVGPATITEDLIRLAIADRVRHALGDIAEPLGDHGAFAPIIDSDMAREREPSGWDQDYSPNSDHPMTLWSDLTAAETDELNEVTSIDLDRLAQLIVDQVVAQTLAFAERHPDLPRGRWVEQRSGSPSAPSGCSSAGA